MTGADAAKNIMSLQVLMALGDMVGIACDIIAEEIQEILEQHPELWGSIDEQTEDKLSTHQWHLQHEEQEPIPTDEQIEEKPSTYQWCLQYEGQESSPTDEQAKDKLSPAS